MEFLGRSWSVSSVEVSKALSHTQNPNLFCYQTQPSVKADSPPVSPRKSDEMKDLFLIHQALNQDFASSHQLLKNGFYRNIMRGRTMGRWIKDQKEKKKHDLRTHNANLHAAISVAGLAAAVAALTATSAISSKNNKEEAGVSKATNAIASAAALVASHCIAIAEDMGAEHDHILSAVSSATIARSNGDIMTLTAGAATDSDYLVAFEFMPLDLSETFLIFKRQMNSEPPKNSDLKNSDLTKQPLTMFFGIFSISLRGAATLRARLQNVATTMSMTEEQGEEVNVLATLNFVAKGGELLKLTRKGDLHWKQVSFKFNTKGQVVAKMKSKHMAGTFTKKKKCVVSGVYVDVPAWPGREMDNDSNEDRQYFGIETTERIIQFECSTKDEKRKWIEGLQHLLNCRSNMARFT